jgi:hypothetical protein
LIESIARERRREHALAAIFLSGFILVFLAQPIRHYATSLYTPADLMNVASLTSVDAAHHPGNPLLSDVVLQMQSWLLFDREELRHGRMPLWNPYNGGGTPLFANYQSAVLSPFSVPFYLWSFKNALIAAAFLKLFCLGFFTYLFLREIELVFLAAMTGAVAFTFAGYNVLLLGYPHPAAMVTLPMALFFAERACKRFENAAIARAASPPRTGAPLGGEVESKHIVEPTHSVSASPAHALVADRARMLRESPMRAVGAVPFLGFGAALLTGLLAGQPEPLYFSVILLGAYLAARIARLWMRTPRDLAAFRRVGSFAGSFLIVGALAAGMAGIQLVPFFEYLRASHLLEQRSDVQTPLMLAIWPLLFFPNLLGNPSTLYHIKESVPPPNFETANLVYSGGIVMLLAVISLLFVNRNRRHAFFALAALVWFVYAYDIGGAWHVFALIPSVEIAPINRSQGIFEFCLACCAAFAVHHLVHARVPVRSMLFASTLFAGVALLTTFLFGAQHLAVYAYAYLKSEPGREAIYQYSQPHLLHVSLMFLPGLLALSAMLLAPRGNIRRALSAVVVISVFLQTGWLFRSYNPISEARFVFPTTQPLIDLAESVGRDRLAVFGEDALLPDSNMLYRISTPASFDGMWIRRYDKLYRETFGEGDNWRPMSRATLQGLELFGVDYVLNRGDWLDVDTPFAEVPDNAQAYFETGEILPGTDVVQEFTGMQDRLQAIRVFAGSLGHSPACTLRVALEDPRDGRTLAAHEFDCRTLAADAAQRTSLVFAFDPIADSRGRSFRLRASSTDARAGAGVSLWCRSDWPYWTNLALWRATLPRTERVSPPPTEPHEKLAAWRLSKGGDALGGGLCFDLSASRGAFQTVRSIGDQTLYKIRGSPSRYHWVGRALAVESDAQAYALVQSPEFDPKSAVVLDRSDAGDRVWLHDDDVASRVRIVDEEPTRIHLKLENPRAGWIVLTQPWYPGWIARVDGEERSLVRANYAFSAVRIATGESEIELAYEPPSFRRGCWITSLSLVGMTLFLSLLAWRSRSAAISA